MPNAFSRLVPWLSAARHDVSARVSAPASVLAAAASAAAGDTHALDTKASRAGALIAIEHLRRPVWTPRDYAAFAREGYMQNAVVYRSVRMVAEAAASIPVLLYDGDHEIDAHPLIDLIARPAPQQSAADFFEAWYGYLLVAGNAYAEAVAIDGELRELHVLRPDRMKVIPGADGWPEAYEYTVAGNSVRFHDESVDGVPPILHCKLFHPANDHYGMSPIEAASTAIDIHNTAAEWNKALLDNSARPSGALVYTGGEGRMTAEQFQRLREELEAGFQGARQAGRPLLLEGGLDWKALGLTPKDMDFIEAKNAAAREIALALGVPPMLLGIPGDNTYSNYQEAQRAFWRSTVLPLFNRTMKALSAWLAPAWDAGLALRGDLDQIDALTIEREALWARLQGVSFLTDDEKRAAIGYGPMPTPAMEAPAPIPFDDAAAPTSDEKFDPGQPRHPAGTSEGGRWSGGGGGASATESSSSHRQTGSEDAPAAHTLIDTATGERVDITVRDGRKIIERVGEDGVLVSRIVENQDGSRLESEFRSPNDAGEWNERHVLTTTEGKKYWVTTTGDTQRISTGIEGDTLISTSEWTANGPELRVQPAFAANPQVLRDVLTLYGGMNAAPQGSHSPVIVFKADEFEPGKVAPIAIWLGSRTREQVDQACPRHVEVQIRADAAAQAVRQAGNFSGRADYGTKVHKHLEQQIKAVGNPDFRAEVSVIKSIEENYGKSGSIRVDVFEHVRAQQTVCVYDIKTGRSGLTFPRAREIATNVQYFYPGTQRIIVIETRPK